MREKQNKQGLAQINQIVRVQRLVLLIAGLLFCQQYCTAQTTAIDSLKGALTKYRKEDTGRANLLLHISAQYHDISADSQRFYAEEAYRIVKKTGDKSYLVRAMNQVGAAYLVSGKYDSSLAMYRAALDICNQNGLTGLKEYIYTNMGSVHHRLGDYPRAITYFDSGAAFAEKNNNRAVLARIFTNLGLVYYEQGAYELALKNYLGGLEIHEQLNNKEDIEVSLLNMSNVYYSLRDYNKAKAYATKAIKMAKESGSDYSLVSCYTTLASILSDEKKYDSAMIYHRQAMALAVGLNQAYVVNIIKGNTAECYLNLGYTDSAYALYKESLALSEQLKDKEGIAVARSGIGQVMIKKGQVGEGVNHLEAALKIMSESGLKEQALATAETLAKTFEQNGDYKSAIRYYKVKEAYRDSLAKEEALRNARRLEFDYELDKKEAQIALLKKDKDIEAASLKQQRLLLIAAVIGLILASTIAFLFFSSLRNAKRNNELITRQKQELEQQAERLEQLNQFKDTTFSVLSHDLRSPINALTGTMAMMDEGIVTPEEFAVYKNELNNKLQSVSLMLDNLLLWARSQMKGEHTLSVERINVRRNVLRVFAVLKDAADHKDIRLVNDVDEGLYILADRNQIEMVARNIVSNAIKFTPHGGMITVDASAENDKVSISITDTGVGMTQEQIDQLFKDGTNASTQGTGGEKGTGIGLILSYNFVKNNGGDMAVSSKPGRGTTFTVTLPAGH